MEVDSERWGMSDKTSERRPPVRIEMKKGALVVHVLLRAREKMLTLDVLPGQEKAL